MVSSPRRTTNDIDVDPEGQMQDHLPEKVKKWILRPLARSRSSTDIRRGGIRE
jgi:hypothetical protein